MPLSLGNIQFQVAYRIYLENDQYSTQQIRHNQALG